MPRERFSLFDGGGGGGGSSVADLIMRSGQARANAELRGGEIWGDAIQGIGQNLVGGLQAYKSAEDDKTVQSAIMAATKARPMAKPGMDVNGDPAAETGPPDIQSILGSIQDPTLRSRAMKGIQDWTEFDAKRQESGLRIKKLEDDLAGAQKERTQHDLDTVAVGAFHAKDWLDQPDGGLSAITLLSQQAKGAKIPGAEQYDEFLAGAQDAWQAAGNDPNAQANVANAVREQAGPLLQRMMAAGSAGVQEKFAPKTREVQIQNADGSITRKIVDDKPGQTFTGAPPRETRSLEAQRAEALARGDAPKAASLLKQLGENAAATRDPAAGGFNLGPGEQRRDRHGNVIAERDSKPTAPQKLTKEERQDFASWNYALPKMESFAKYVKANPDKYGKWDAFVQGLKQQVPGFADGEYASKEAFIGRLNSEIRHALFGASLTEGEKESAGAFLIGPKDQPVEILAKLAEATARGRSNFDYYKGLGFNIPTPDAGAAPAASAGPTATGPNGQKLVLRNGKWVPQ